MFLNKNIDIKIYLSLIIIIYNRYIDKLLKINMEIFWVKLDKLRYKDFFNKITSFKKQSIIFTPNPEILLKTKVDKKFKKILEKANYLVPDWIGLYVASQILNSSIKWKILQFLLLPYYIFNLFFRRKFLYNKYWDKICWSDITYDLLNFSEKKWVKVSIIDLYNPSDIKKVESQNKFISKLKNNFSKLDFDYFIYNPEKKAETINKIILSKSKILTFLVIFRFW